MPVPSALGPMARDVDSLALCMKALLCEEMFRLDPTVPPIPFNEEVSLVLNGPACLKDPVIFVALVSSNFLDLFEGMIHNYQGDKKWLTKISSYYICSLNWSVVYQTERPPAKGGEEGNVRRVSPLLQVYSSSAPLRVGYYDTDGYFPLPPCMRRAVRETREALQAAGHKVSTTTPHSSPRGVLSFAPSRCNQPSEATQSPSALLWDKLTEAPF